MRLFRSFVLKVKLKRNLFLVWSLQDTVNTSPRWSKSVCGFVRACVCVCFSASGGFYHVRMRVCVFKREEREETGTRVDDSQALMDGGVLTRAK